MKFQPAATRALARLRLRALAANMGGLCGLALGAAAGVGTAQEAADDPIGLKEVRMVRTATPPVVDGVLDDSVWALAAVVDDFKQSQPIEGDEPTERTEIYLLYDDDALYIGGRFWDSEPDQIAAGTLRHRTLRLGDDDRIAVVLSPYNDRRSGYKFETNANGVKHEGIYQNVRQNLSVWDTIWDASSRIDAEGWTTEIEIPFKSISFDPNDDTWGMNFSRAVRRKSEEITWVSRNRSYNPSVVGIATGFQGLEQGIGLDVVPSIALNRRRAYDPTGTDSDSRPSLDMFYKFTPALNGALTLNTDFSATEVDSRQVNLTRFNLFFPERRAFFLQDTDIFEFGRIGGSSYDTNRASSRSTRENGRPFFSRRLGLSLSGQPVDLDYGGKISGRVGRWSVGGLAIRQAEFGPVASGDVFAGRASLSVLEESAIGLIVTDGDPNSNVDNSVAGVDFRYLNSRLAGGRLLEADAWFQQSQTEGSSGDDQAFGVALGGPNRSGLRWGLALKEIQRNFNPAQGYVSRTGIRDQTVDVGYTHIISGGPLVSFYAGVDAQRIEYIDGGLQTQVLAVRPLELSTRARDRIYVRLLSTDEVLNQPFRIHRDPSGTSPDVIIPPGRYLFDEHLVEVSSGSYRRLAGSLTYQAGDFFNGERINIGGDVTWRPTKHFTFKFAYDRNDIRLPQGEFVTRLMQLTTEIPFSSNVSWINFIQFDNVSERAGIDSRLHWVQRDGREAYVVLTHNLQDMDRDNSFDATLSDLSLKVNYTIRF